MSTDVQEEAPKITIRGANTVVREIDWDKVATFEDLKNILIAMNLVIDDEPDNPDVSVACIRYLFKPLTSNDGA